MRHLFLLALCATAVACTAPVDDTTGDGTTSNLGAAAALDESTFYDVRVTYVQFRSSRSDGHDYDPLGNPPDPYVCFGENACTTPCTDTYGCIPSNDGRLMEVDSHNWNDDTHPRSTARVSGADLINGLALRTMDSDDIYSDVVDELWATFSTTAPAETFLQVGPDSLIDYRIVPAR